jgi:hypothetical protein
MPLHIHRNDYWSNLPSPAKMLMRTSLIVKADGSCKASGQTVSARMSHVSRLALRAKVLAVTISGTHVSKLLRIPCTDTTSLARRKFISTQRRQP